MKWNEINYIPAYSPMQKKSSAKRLLKLSLQLTNCFTTILQALYNDFMENA